MQNSKCCNCNLPALRKSIECCKNCQYHIAWQSDSEYQQSMRDFERELDLANDEQHLKDLENEHRPTWDETFMEVAKVVAKRSKDPHTKVGCVIVKDGRILSIGYNGEPRHFNYQFDWSTSEKYDYVIHAELNAIANANYNNTSVKDGIVYLTLSPCKDCIKLLAQHGIKTIYYLDEYKDFDKTKFIAENAGICLIKM